MTNDWKDKTCITLMDEIVRQQKHDTQVAEAYASISWIEKQEFKIHIKELIEREDIQALLEYFKDK
jgi:hypothetical protein